ncbi:hypothetical protein BDN72DRAFT_880231 [Pluteus cervinus]|uniref:Uncharacterized protein n=1 Tax=Pluteus cervinus TaxID=181527 RepID=A0ACD3ALP7_9AGAR|nr:hypothetical protein BDN72DRAFT_880231 [Pluteus cervinus]
MPMTHADRSRNEGSTSSLKVTSKIKQHLNGNVSPADLPRKKRVAGACDVCKRKKIRCDSGDMPDYKCTNCIQFGHECSHRDVTKHLLVGPAKVYVEGLEQKVERMEKLLSQALPGVDFNQDVNVPPVALPRNDLPLMQQFSKLQINPPQSRFFGQSSTIQLVQTAMDMKSEYTGSTAETKQPLASRRLDNWPGPSRFRTTQLETPIPPPFTFPEPDLLKSLVDLYFKELSIFSPLLHRPTFDSSVAADLHLRDREFGAVVLLVCALGAKFSDDPRVFSDISVLEGEGMSDEEKARVLLGSCGWRWFEQINLTQAGLLKRPTLYELQAHALSVLFGQTSEEAHGVWTQTGLAMRMAQDVGAHRKRTKYESRAQDELWKRAFWVIACQDRMTSSFKGRPLCLQPEDIDVEFPAECDDEYWDHIDPEQRFKQPVGKPSVMAFFTCYLNLTDILAWAMRAIYSLSRPQLGRFAASMKYSEQQSLSDLDSAMNRWMGALPDHLRWNPNHENPIFLAQSATLHAMYYQLQILIHRPFIPSPRDPTPSTYPSLAICTNAARSCFHVLETPSKRNLLPLSTIAMPTFTAAVVLLLNVWSGKRSGVSMHLRREYESVQKCLDTLRRCEKRWPMAGRLLEILTELASVGDAGTQSSTASEPESNSRETSPASTNVSQKSSPSQSVDTSSSSVPSPGSAPPSKSQQSVPLPTATTNTQQRPNFALPFYTNELGSLPVFGQFDFLDPPASSGPLNQSPLLQHLPPCAFDPSLFMVGNNSELGSSSSSLPAPTVFAAPAHATTASSQVTSSLPISSLPYPITAQLGPLAQTAAGSNTFTAQDNLQDIFSFANLYPYQSPTQVPSISRPVEDALIAAELMAQFSGLNPDDVNVHSANGLGLGTIPGLASVSSLGSIPNLGVNPNLHGGPSGESSGQDVSGQTAQPWQDLLCSTDQMILDEDMLTIWSTAPSGFWLEDWGTYITSVDQIMRDQTMM